VPIGNGQFNQQELVIMSYNNRILVIDDDPEILEIFKAVLKKPHKTEGSSIDELNVLLTEMAGDTGHGKAKKSARFFHVDTATQGKEGCNKVREARGRNSPFAVVFVDMRMPPGWDGIKTVQAIHAVDPRVQIVIVTAYADATITEIVEKVGFTDRLLYLKKPFDDEEILQLADSLSMRWNSEKKVRSFMHIFEGMLGCLADLDLSGDYDKLKPFFEGILSHLGSFLGTNDLFLARIVDAKIEFRIGLGKFANGFSSSPAFQEMVQKLEDQEQEEKIFHLDEYIVMPILVQRCKNIVVGILQEDREIEGLPNLLTILATDTAKILEQAKRNAEMRKELDQLRLREKELVDRIRQIEAAAK
jgi:CheY-like chemotaxis protein